MIEKLLSVIQASISNEVIASQENTPPPSPGRREQGHAVFSWQLVSRDFWGQADLTDVTIPVRRGGKPAGEVVWGWCQGSGNRPADLFGT